MKIGEVVVVARFGDDLPAMEQSPISVDESAANVEPTPDDLEEARQNYLGMDVLTRSYVDALAKRFDGVEDDRTLN